MIESYTPETDDMRSTQPLSITLPNEMAEAVKAKVARGEYATESEVIRAGLRSLMTRDRAIERWLRIEVAAACDELGADPSKAMTPDGVRASLVETRKRRAAARGRRTPPCRRRRRATSSSR